MVVAKKRGMQTPAGTRTPGCALGEGPVASHYGLTAGSGAFLINVLVPSVTIPQSLTTMRTVLTPGQECAWVIGSSHAVHGRRESVADGNDPKLVVPDRVPT